MKVELIHRIDADGEWFVVRQTEEDKIPDNRYFIKPERAEAYYQVLIQGLQVKEEILKSTEI